MKTNEQQRREQLGWLPTESLINKILDLELANEQLRKVDISRKQAIDGLLSEVNSLRTFKKEVLKPELDLAAFTEAPIY